MANVQKILNNVLSKVSLTPAEEKKINEISKKVLIKAKKAGLNAQIGGSLAKRTLIKKTKQDVDIFVQFSDSKEMEKFPSKVRKLDSTGQFLHGSRDYFSFVQEGVSFEIIPVLKFKKPELAENVTDFSLIHVNFIKKEIKKNPKLANEIKLAKAFCHAQNCYGAESYIGGFSGYALEVLICNYGSFINFLKKVQNDKIIDQKKQFKNKNEIMRELNQSKLNSPIILIDPTHKYRNVCAGLSKETFELFVKSTNEFLKNPSEEAFVKKEFDSSEFIKKAKKENLEVLELDFITQRQEGDIAGTKMKKLFRFLTQQLERKEQKVVYSEFIYDLGQTAKAYLAIKLKKELEIIGPTKEMKEAIDKFKKVRKEIYFSKGFACAKEIFNLEEFFEKQKEVAQGMFVEFDWKKI